MLRLAGATGSWPLEGPATRHCLQEHSPTPECQLMLGTSATAAWLGPRLSMNRRQAPSEARKLHSLHFAELAAALDCRQVLASGVSGGLTA